MVYIGTVLPGSRENGVEGKNWGQVSQLECFFKLISRFELGALSLKLRSYGSWSLTASPKLLCVLHWAHVWVPFGVVVGQFVGI